VNVSYIELKRMWLTVLGGDDTKSRADRGTSKYGFLFYAFLHWSILTRSSTKKQVSIYYFVDTAAAADDDDDMHLHDELKKFRLLVLVP
jgi:hypothetical protein